MGVEEHGPGAWPKAATAAETAGIIRAHVDTADNRDIGVPAAGCEDQLDTMRMTGLGRARMTRRPGIVPALGLAAASIVLVLLLIEGALRAMPQYLPGGTRLALDVMRATIALDSAQQADPELGLKVKPNSDVLVDSHPDYRYHVKTYLNFPDRGFRGNVIARPLVGVAVGDSFTFGTGVEAEEAWPEQLSRLAEGNFANLGVFGYGPPQYTTILKKYALPLRPKIVLYALFLHNDLADAVHFVEWRQQGGSYKERFISRSRFLARHSRLYQLLLFPKNKPGLRVAAADQKKLIIQLEEDRPIEQVKVALEAVKQAVLSARELTLEEGETLVLLLLPSKAQTYRHLLMTPKEPQEVYGLDEANRRVLMLCEKYQIRCLDLTPRFMERALTGEPLYFRIDGHWNAAGHRLAARTIYDYLINNQLLERGKQTNRGEEG